MDIQHLREFVTLGKSVSLAAAARDLHVSQSTLSRHVSALEREVGATLMERGATGSSLTEEGQYFLEEAIAVVDRYDQALAGLRRLKGRTRHFPVCLGGNLRSQRVVQVASAIASVIARQGLPVSLSLYEPHTSASLRELAAHDPYAAAVKGIVDISLVWVSTQRDWTQFERKSVLHEPLAVFVPEDHQLAGVESVSLADLDDCVVVVSTAYTNYFDAVQDAFARVGATFKARTRVFESYGDQMIARHSDEVFVVPRPDVARVADASVSGLVARDILDPEAYVELEAIYLKDNKNPGLAFFPEILDAGSEAIKKQGTGCRCAACADG